VTASRDDRPGEDVDAIAARQGGLVVGYIPVINQYVLQFAQNSTLDGLNALRLRVAAESGVRGVDFSRLHRLSTPFAIDVQSDRDIAGRSLPLERIQLFEAIDAIRTTEPYTRRASLKSARVAVIDTGFAPGAPAEFPGATVQYFEQAGAAGFQPTTALRDESGQEHAAGHGTLVASIIVAANDGLTGASGVLNSAVAPAETPFAARVYGAHVGGSVPAEFASAALDHIKSRGDIDVVNMSFGDYSAPTYLGVIRALRGSVLIAAAVGNDGVRMTHYPAAFAATEPNVIAVGATEADEPNVDHRLPLGGPAIFTRPILATEMCDPTTRIGGWPRSGSNCGSDISIAAPGRVWSVNANHAGFPPYGWCPGTSCAAPVVAGVAALLQTIRLGNNPLAPSDVKDILLRTATDISAQWGGPMKRVNAFNAVLELLQSDSNETVLVADHDASIGGTGKGALVTVNVDSVTGQPVPGDATGAISLDIPEEGLVTRKPRSIAVSPDGTTAFVYVESQSFGDGLLVVAMDGRRAFNFIPLSGAPFPAVQGQSGSGNTFTSSDVRPPMAFSKDGRLLYVAANNSLLIVNAEEHTLVTKFSEMPAPFNAMAYANPGGLQGKLLAMKNIIANGAATGTKATGVTSLVMSPDGTRLFVTVQTGHGTGAQPGYTMALNVDLYNDASPTESGLQPDLGRYLQVSGFSGPTPLSTRPQADEPSDAVVSPDGRFLYVVNGGAAAYGPPDPDKAWLSYGLAVISESSSGITIVSPKQKDFADQEFKEGFTIVDAPGVIEGYPVAAGAPAAPRFTSSINYGWNPSEDSGGLVLSPNRFGPCSPNDRTACRFGRTESARCWRSSRRATSACSTSTRRDTSSRRPATSPQAYLPGVVGVTEAIPLDKNLWPDRDRELLPDGGLVSPDEKLMFPTQVEYSQSGGFAVGIHTGVHIPESFVAHPWEGGGVSFINDQKITFDLEANASRLFEPHDDGLRPYYSMTPVCETADEALKTCTASTVTTLFDYRAGGLNRRFARPRGVAIGPIFSIAEPRFGDPVYSTTDITLRWRVSASRLTVKVFDLGAIGSPSAPMLQGRLPDRSRRMTGRTR
jgi:hypothetical protein